jgi:RNA polymerase sigma-70 factor, ECF subfamily
MTAAGVPLPPQAQRLVMLRAYVEQPNTKRMAKNVAKPDAKPDAKPARVRPEPSEQAKVDDLLIRRFCDGELRAFELLVVKYQRRVAALINASVRNDSVAEELTQETFLRAYRGLPNFRFESAFSTWLYAIARNTAISYHRDGHGRADSAVSLDALAEENGDIEPRVFQGATSGPEAEMHMQQIVEQIQQSISKLSPAMREALTLREMDGLSYLEIAEQLNVPLNTARSLIFRAREAVANEIRPLLDVAVRERNRE